MKQKQKPVGPIRDVNSWLSSNGIKRRWADALLIQMKKEYPHLAQALKGHNSNRAELDLLLLVVHTMQGRFPVKSKDKRL